MDSILKVTVLLTLTLALAFLIERTLEVLKAVYDFMDCKLNWHEFWTRRTINLKNRLEKGLRSVEYVKPEHAAMALKKVNKALLNSQPEYAGTVPVLSGDLVRVLSVKVIFKVIGLLLGVGLAFWMQIDLLEVWEQAAGPSSKWVINLNSQCLRIAISGLVIGLGSSPMHKVITALEKTREKREQKGK